MASENADFMSIEASSSSSLSIELPASAVGAEVDCPGGNDTEGASPARPPSQQQTEEDTQKSASSELPAAPSGVLRGRRRPKRLEDKNCSCCKTEFERQGRSFNRRAVYTFTSPEAVQWVFPEAVVHDKSFLCEPCAQVIRSKCKRKHSGKRPLWLIPPVSELRDKKKKGRRMGKKSKAAQLVSKSRYKAAFKLLWSAKGARKPMMEFWRKQLKEEMKTLMRQTDNPFHQKVSSKKPLSSFPWRDCLNWAQEKAPLVTSCLTSLFPDINALFKSSQELSEEQAQMLLERRAVVALSIPLFTRNIWKNNFLQAALGAELRLQGCSGSALDVLNSMGLCQNKEAVRLLLLRLQNGTNALTQNGQRTLKQELLKGEHMADVEEEEEEEDEEEEDEDDDEEVDGEEDEDEEAEDDEEEPVDEEQEPVDEEQEPVDEEQEPVDEEQEPVDEEQEPVDEEQDEEEIEMAVQEEVEVENQVSDEKAETEKKKRRKKAKKQRKKRGKRKVQEREEEEVEEEEEDDEGSEEKKRRVVVVRLGLL